jgi:hypothetical protein
MLCAGLDRIACCGKSLGTQIDCFEREATRGRRMYREPEAQLGVRRAYAPILPGSLELILGHKSMSSTERYLHGSQKQAWADAQRLSMEVF